MTFAKKTLYALRAVYELAKRYGRGPTTIGEIAEAQALPPRFLENILMQLKGAEILESARGKEGGYWLARPPEAISVGDVVRAMEASVDLIKCLGGKIEETCPMRENCSFLPMWERAQRALFEVYDGTSYADLVAQQHTFRPPSGEA